MEDASQRTSQSQQRRPPQHGTQRPRRPAHPPLPPGHDGHRRLTPEETATAPEEPGRNDFHGGRGLVYPVRGSKGVEVSLSATEQNNLKRPNQQQRMAQEKLTSELQMRQRGRDGDKIREENDRRKRENKRLKLQLKKQKQRKRGETNKRQQETKKKDKKQQQKDKDKAKLQQDGKIDKEKKDKNKKDKNKNGDDGDKSKKDDEGKMDRPEKDNDRPDKKDGKDKGKKKEKDEKGKDKTNNDGDKPYKPDKKDKDKPSKNDDKATDMTPNQGELGNDEGQDADKPDKKKKDKDKKNKDKPSKGDDELDTPNKKDKPDKNDGKATVMTTPNNDKLGEVIDYKPGKRPNKVKFDPKQLKELGVTRQQAARLAKYGVTLDDMSLMSAKERERWIKMTDGKFNLSGYRPPKEEEDDPRPNNGSANNSGGNGGKEDKPKPNNGGGGSFSSNLKPKKPKTPKPTPLSVPAPPPNQSPIYFSPAAEKPTRTPRPTADSDWKFVESLSDPSVQLDGFEYPSELDWTMLSTDPWMSSSTHTYEGRKSLKSGIDSETYALGGGRAVYSNLTLTTDGSFEGGVLTFMVWARQMRLPNEAFFVSVDGVVALPPAATASHSAAANSDGWVEYSVPVGGGEHKVTWCHVYNPFDLSSLPPQNGEVGLWMDDVRYAPFSTPGQSGVLALNQMEMTNEADGVDSVTWNADGTGMLVSTSEFRSEKDGSADIKFVLRSLRGGTLKYRIRTSTTAPNDDFAILLNGEVRDAVFGEMLGFEQRALNIPPGKQKVTLTHRKNPGQFGRGLLESLGEIATEGKTWLEDVWFEMNY